MGCAPLGPPPVPIFWYISHFDLEKNKGRTFGMKRRRLEVELGQEYFCPPVEQFRRANFPPEGEVIVIIITNNSHREGVNLHQHLHQHHLLSNSSSSLVSNLVSKTTNWYLWVASSVDYSL